MPDDQLPKLKVTAAGETRPVLHSDLYERLKRAIEEKGEPGEINTKIEQEKPVGEKPLILPQIIADGPAHGQLRLIVAAGALAICLAGPASPWVPNDIKTGLLAIGGSIATSIFKGFEKY